MSLSQIIENTAQALQVEVPGKVWRVTIVKHRQVLSTYIMLALLIGGLFMPSSFNGQITLNFQRGAEVLLVALFFLLFLLNGLSSPLLLICSLSIPLFLLLATILSPLSDIAAGVAIYYIPFSLMICLNLRAVKWSKLLEAAFVIVCITNLLFNFFVIVSFKPANLFLMNLYTSINPRSLYLMLILNSKPVFTYTLHSVAALMYFLFFVCNICAFKAKKNSLYLFLAAGYFASCFFLYSNTAFFILFFMVLFGLYKLRPAHLKECVTSGATVLLLLILVVVTAVSFSDVLSDKFARQYKRVELKVTSKVNGLYGRYTSEGGQSENIKYAIENPHLPAGFRKNEDIHYRDSGIVEYFVRGSFGLVISIYFGLFLFLFINLRSRSTALILFLVILAAEAGFSYMSYPRFQYLLPFLIVFLNSLEKPIVPGVQ